MTDKSVVPRPVRFLESAIRKVRFTEPTVLTNEHLDAFQRGDPVPGAIEQPSNPLSLETSDLDPITPEEDAAAMGVIAALGFTRQAHDTVVRGMRAGLAKAGAVIVPVEPTEAMYDAGYDATRLSDGTPQFAKAGYCIGHSGNIYRSMLSAHSIQNGGEGGEA